MHIVVSTRAYVLQIALVRAIHGSPREFQVSTYLQNTAPLPPDIRPRVISLFGYGRIIRQKSERINVNELKLSTSAFLHVPSAKRFLVAFSLFFFFFFFFFSRFFFPSLHSLKQSIDRSGRDVNDSIFKLFFK